MKENWLEKPPQGVTPHNFGEPCNTHGGSAFRNWYMLYKHKGVFVGFNNHKWCVRFSSDPYAEWTRGCQQSSAHGDPLPYSKTAKLLRYDDLPNEAKPLAEKWVREAIEIVREKIESYEKQEEEKKRKRLAEMRNQYNKEIAQPWMEALEKEGVDS